MLDEILPVYGEVFLKYILAVDVEVLNSQVSLSSQQTEVLGILHRFASMTPPTATDTQGMERYVNISGLGRWQEESQSSIADALRVHAGGALPVPPVTSDPVLEQLFAIARDVWPSLLVTPPSGRPMNFMMSSPMGALTHPALPVAAKAFLRDGQLKELFPGHSGDAEIESLDDLSALLGISAQWISNAGRGGTQGLSTLLSQLISNSYIGALAEFGNVSWHGLTGDLEKSVERLRSLADGDVANVPRLVAFAGLRLPDDSSLTIADGSLRQVRSTDREMLFYETGSATSVFLTTFPLRLLNIEPWAVGTALERSSESWAEVRNDFQKADRELDLVRLAVLLSSPDDQVFSLTQVASLIMDPTSPGGINQGSVQRHSASFGELDSGGEARINQWWNILKEKHPESLDIAMRRSLSAAGDRLDPIDGFVDAVVAWENCFGTSTETTFRVSGASAAILEPSSATARLAQQKIFKRIYDKRSRVVHGALHLTAEDAGELRKTALDIAVRCLRLLYTDRSDILPLKSEDRSTRLMLGGLESSDDDPGRPDEDLVGDR